MASNTIYDAIIVGAGVSGSFIARELTDAGMKCVLVEAGRHYAPDQYPTNELDSNAQLYWGGGVELNTDASIGFLRPRAVGGGSVVNQALLDRFDDLAFDEWRDVSGVDFLSREQMDPYYDRAAERFEMRSVPEEYRNGNAEVFRTGFEANGYLSAPLIRAQRDCRFDRGNSCIVCLAGCPISSKQSTSTSVLPAAFENGLELESEFEVGRVTSRPDGVEVQGRDRHGETRSLRGARLILACGAIGNSQLLLASGFGDKLPALGQNFWTHPQYMQLGIFDEPVDAQYGPMQSYKSADPGFRRRGFKLENVYAPPVALSMLLPGFGRRHQDAMRLQRHYACIEVCVRDTSPGRIRVARNGRATITKSLNDEDRRRRDRGLDAIRNIFHATGVKEIVSGSIAIGLHLMGGCGLGTDSGRSVVAPDFRVHGLPNVWAADSSIFPTSPGINPSYTIMALALRGADSIVAGAR
ncbi:MAG: choline dehydrogenase-like flavoprotein [Hyphomicrobiaceae bacterium]